MKTELADSSASRAFDSNRVQRAVPMSAVLSALVGLGLLVLFWHGRHFVRPWPDVLELAFVTAASFLLVWGLTELAGAFFFRSAGRDRAAIESTRPRLDVVSWSGIVLVSLGAGSLFLVHRDSMFGYLPILCLALGVVLLIIGGKRFVDRLLRGTSSATTTQRVALTRPGAMTLVISVLLLGGAFLGPSNMLMLVFAMVVGPFIINGWFAFGVIRRLTVKRTLQQQILAGEPMTVTLSLTNRKRRLSSWLMTATDTIIRTSPIGNGEPLRAETFYSRIPARSRRDAGYRLRLMRRGRYVFGPIRVRSRFPLGLVERSLTIPLTSELIVAPRLGRLSDRWRSEAAAADELVQRQRPRRGAFPDEFEKLRLFRYGDNPRLIHWRTSARQNVLMVREYHEVRDRDLLVLLDLRALPDDRAAQLQVEQAVSFGATVCVDQLRRSRQSRISVAVAGRETTTWTGTAHPASAEPLLGELALAESSANPDLEALWTFARANRSPATAGVFITTRRSADVVLPPFATGFRTVSAADGLDDLLTLT